jgi:hypothetical protein
MGCLPELSTEMWVAKSLSQTARLMGARRLTLSDARSDVVRVLAKICPLYFSLTVESDFVTTN